MLAPGLMPDATRSGRSPNPPSAAASTAVAGRRVDRVHRDVGELGPLVTHDLGRVGAEELADRGARTAAVVGGRDHHHVVAVGGERDREGLEMPGASTPSSLVTRMRTRSP